jgi:hypothetical protein
MAEERLVTELVIDSSQALAGAKQFADALKSAGTASDELAGKVNTVSEVVELSGRQIAKQNTALAAQGSAAGGASGALASLSKTLDQTGLAQQAVTRLMQQGAISYGQAQAELAALSARERDAAVAIEGLRTGQLSVAAAMQRFPTLFSATTSAVNDNTRAFGLNRIGLLELQAAGINAFQSLASGMSAFRVAETEGAQGNG